eukprot:2579188-Pyramimonas_sp.AAC.1
MARGPKDWITAQRAHELMPFGFNDQLTGPPSRLRMPEWLRGNRAGVCAFSRGSGACSSSRARVLHNRFNDLAGCAHGETAA